MANHIKARRFVLYRRQPPQGHLDGGYANAPDQVQLEGIEFSDGTVCVRWMTDLRSHSIWPDFATFDKVHGHPEYDSELRWLDPGPEGEFSAAATYHFKLPEPRPRG